MTKTPGKPRKWPTRDYATGYCRPPEHSRIKKGQVLNPYGRNGKPVSEVDAFEKARRRPSRVTIDGETVMIASDEAFYLLQMTKAMAGDKTAAKIIAQELGARRRLGPPPPTAEELEQQKAEQARSEELSKIIVDSLESLAAIRGGGK